MVGGLLGLGAGGEEGMEAGAIAGAEAAADGVDVFDDDDAWDVLEELPNDAAAALDPARAPLGDRAARRGRSAPAASPSRDTSSVRSTSSRSGCVSAEEAEALAAAGAGSVGRTIERRNAA